MYYLFIWRHSFSALLWLSIYWIYLSNFLQENILHVCRRIKIIFLSSLYNKLVDHLNHLWDWKVRNWIVVLLMWSWKGLNLEHETTSFRIEWKLLHCYNGGDDKNNIFIKLSYSSNDKQQTRQQWMLGLSHNGQNISYGNKEGSRLVY